jgi:hypothetical protein
MAERCPNHPETAVEEGCKRCGRPFCEQCLVELQQQRVCADCKTAVLGELQRGRPVDPARVVFWARIFDWVLAVPALFLGIVWLVSSSNPGNGSRELYPLFALLGLVFPLPPAIALGPGRRWAYYYQMATLIVGTLLSGCSFALLSVGLWIPAAILLVYWVRPEVRAYCEDGR